MSLVLAMLLAAQDPISVTNRAYTDCLLKQTVSNLEEKKSVGEFEKAAAAACSSEKQAYHDAVQTSETEFGSSPSEAKTYADEEVANIEDSMKANYESSVNSGTAPIIK